MPANLTQQYHKAEQAYRRASSPEEELDCLQVMLKELPKHKGTDKMQADLKQKISRVKKEIGSAKKTSGGKRGVRLPRQGAGRVVVIGGPNAGKSQLLATMTNAQPEVADYPFTTREPQPGMMPWEDVMVQMIDTPPITSDVYEPTVQGLIRGADLVLLMVDLGNDDGGEQLRDVWNQLQNTKTRLGRNTELDEDDVGIAYTRAYLVYNKMDLPDANDRIEFFQEYIDFDLEEFRVSAQEAIEIETLRNAIYHSLNVVRVYTKLPTKKEPDFSSPFTLKRGETVMELAEQIHKDVAKSFKNARVWGSEVHDGTPVKGDYVIHDRDIVELHY